MGNAPGQPGFADVVVNGDGTVFVATDAGVWQYETSQFDILTNGGFETEDAWILPTTTKPAQFGRTIVYSGEQAMHIGSFGDVNEYAYSSTRQDVTIPAGTQTAMLTFYTYAASGDVEMAAETAVFPTNSSNITLQPAAAPAGDAQYALILDPSNDDIVEILFWEQSNGQMWHSHSYDLTAYAGQTIRLHFGVYNDGENGRTGMIVDNVSLLADAEINWPFAVYLPVVIKP